MRKQLCGTKDVHISLPSFASHTAFCKDQFGGGGGAEQGATLFTISPFKSSKMGVELVPLKINAPDEKGTGTTGFLSFPSSISKKPLLAHVVESKGMCFLERNSLLWSNSSFLNGITLD